MRGALPVLFTLLGACALPDPPAVGQDGDPRFNLYFDNEAQVDLDLHVADPDGEEISWENPSSASGGALVRDCKCSSCPDGPSEDIVWTDAAPSGVYTVWVAWYSACDGFDSASANFLVRAARSGEVVESWSGALSEGESKRWVVTIP